MSRRQPARRGTTGRRRESASATGGATATPRFPAGRARTRGFTLVELLIVVVLASFIGAVVVNVFRIQNNIFRSGNESVEVDQNLRAGLDLMLRELRNAGMKDVVQTYADRPGIAVADSQLVRFKMDFNSAPNSAGGPDGDVVDPNEDIEYSYTPADGTLRRRTRGTEGDSGAQPMAEFITGVRFTYYDDAGNLLPVPISGAALAAIRRIHVRVTGASRDGRYTNALESNVVPRNLAY